MGRKSHHLMESVYVHLSKNGFRKSELLADPELTDTLFCKDVEKICNIIRTACVLHNLCILAEDDILPFIEHEEDINNYQNIYPNVENGLATRQRLPNLFY
jgi:hypothetical protein